MLYLFDSIKREKKIHNITSIPVCTGNFETILSYVSSHSDLL